jgi:hypothetical protein
VQSCSLEVDVSPFSSNIHYDNVTKEVIRPQVPLRPPCYDFSPLAELWFDYPNIRDNLAKAQLG